MTIHKIIWRFPLFIITMFLPSCNSSSQEDVQNADNEINITVQEPEGQFEEISDDEYNTNLEFVMDSECNLTDKYFDLDYSDPEDELEEDENIYLLSIKSGHHPTRDLTIKKISHQYCYWGYPSSSDIECVFEKGKLVWINAVCDSLFDYYMDSMSNCAKYQYRYYFDKNGDLVECHKKEVHGTVSKEDSLLAVFKKQKLSPCECKKEKDEFLLLIKDILDFLEKNK